MNQRILAGGVAIMAFVACAAGWVLLPSLEASGAAADAEAAVHLERARRTLEQFHHGLTVKSLLLDRLADAEVDVDVEDPAELLEEGADDYQQRHGDRWDSYQPYDYDISTAPRPAKAGYGNLERQIRDGIRSRDALLDDNDRLLDDALAEIEQASRITANEPTSRCASEVARLKGVILYHMGVTRGVEARLLRGQAVPVRRRLAALGATAAQLQEGQTLAGKSEIDRHIQGLQERLAKDEAALATGRQALDKIDGNIAELESRLASARKEAQSARAALEETRQRGAVFGDPKGAEAYAAQVLREDKRFRDADRSARAIEFGTYPHATIDDSGDYIHGQYVEDGSSAGVTVAFGLIHYRNERTVLATRNDEAAKALEGLRRDLGALKTLKDSHQASAAREARRLQATREAGEETFAELSRLESEAFAIEEDALDFFDRSQRASATGARGAAAWASEARDATANMAPQVRARSAFQARSDASWLGGHVAAQEADAAIARAWVHFSRFQDYRQDAEILDRLADVLELSEADHEVEQTKAREAREEALDLIRDAVAVLKRAHRDSGRHWTFVAQEAGAAYLMALLGQESYAGDAIEAYRSALSGRETEPYAQKLVQRLRQLENR